jgi:hypothetical protein
MPRYIVEEISPHRVACRRVVDADNETAALDAFKRGEGAKVEGYPVIGERISAATPRIIAETDDTVSVQLTQRELTLLRVACLGRLDRIVAKADSGELMESYQETKELLDGKLKIARRDLFKKTGEG